MEDDNKWLETGDTVRRNLSGENVPTEEPEDELVADPYAYGSPDLRRYLAGVVGV